MHADALATEEQAGPGSDAAARVALVVVGVGVVAFVVLAALLVPWDPVPGGHLSPTPVHQVFTDAEVARADHFSRWARVWGWSGLALNLVVAAWLGFSRRGRALVTLRRGPWWVRVPVTVAAVSVLVTLAGLPSSVCFQELERRNGLSNEAWGVFAVDSLITLAISVVTYGLGLLVVVACARRWTRAWSAVVGTLLAALVVVGSFVYPVVVEPLFNHFTPLPAGPLRSDILALAAKEHVHVSDVLVADASKQTTTLNAYVSGFGDTRRVVLYDNTIRDLPRSEIDAIVAHELGHAKHDDVLTGTLLGAAAGLAGIGLLSLAVGGLQRRGRPGVRDPAVVPLLIALVTLALFLADPVENTISRRIETRADVASLRTTHDPSAFVAMQKELALTSLQDPSPPWLSQWWFGTHPTPLQRIALAGRVVP